MAGLKLPDFYFGFRADYFTDRLIRIYSVLLFLVLSITITVDFASDHAMTCWTPAQFTAAHVAYTNQACLQRSRFYEVGTDTFLVGHRDNHVVGQNISKMQALAVLLAFQALLFLLPWLLWRLVSGVGYHLDAIMKESIRTSGGQQDLSYALNSSPFSIDRPIAGGYVLPFLYLLFKLFNFLVCFVQMGIISSFFNLNFFVYKSKQSLWEPYRSVNVILEEKSVGNNSELVFHTTNVTAFPRIVLCDFQMRHQARVHSYVVQCSIGLADTAELCLTVIWLWLIAVMFLTAVSGIYHLLQGMFWCMAPQWYKKTYLTKRLRHLESYESASSELVIKFCNLLLKPDVFFVADMVEENGSMTAGTEMIKGLWMGYLKASKIQVDEGEGLEKREALGE